MSDIANMLNSDSVGENIAAGRANIATILNSDGGSDSSDIESKNGSGSDDVNCSSATNQQQHQSPYSSSGVILGFSLAESESNSNEPSKNDVSDDKLAN